MEQKAVFGTSMVKGKNHPGGIFICGYEWGGTAGDPTDDFEGEANIFTFSQKFRRYGMNSMIWPFDSRILKWFELWGYDLSLPMNRFYDESIVQGNWCGTKAPKLEYKGLQRRLEQNFRHFVNELKALSPRIVLLFGKAMYRFLTKASNKELVETSIGRIEEVDPVWYRRERLSVCRLVTEKYDIIAFPHPSGTRGISFDMVAGMSQKASELLERYKLDRLGGRLNG